MMRDCGVVRNTRHALFGSSSLRFSRVETGR
jgi:hypothetical protein